MTDPTLDLWRREIGPLMEQIHDWCKAHDVPFVGAAEHGDGISTTTVNVRGDSSLVMRLLHANACQNLPLLMITCCEALAAMDAPVELVTAILRAAEALKQQTTDEPQGNGGFSVDVNLN
jgi:hypothetical protein